MEARPKVALVTGSSGGIGRAIAKRLAQEGMSVAIVARVDARYPATPQDAVDEIRAMGGIAAPFECDLSVPEERAELVARVEKELGPVDVLVNNAAVSTFERVAQFRPSRLNLMLEVQVRAVFELSQAVLPAMTANGRGWIFNITSMAAVPPPVPLPPGGSLNTVYGMCKAAVERLSVGMAAESYADGIDVNALAPTHIVPTFGAGAFFDLGDRPQENADDIANALAHLIRPLDSRVTGKVLYSQDVLATAGIDPAAVA